MNGPFIVAYGDEPFLLDSRKDWARSQKRSVTMLDALDGLSDEDVVSTCVTPTLDDAKRIVVVDNAQKVKGESALKEYVESGGVSDGSVLLLAIVRSATLPSVWKLAGQSGRVHHCKKLAPWEDEKLVKFVRAEAGKIGLRMEDNVPFLLVQQVGPELHRLVMEIRKMLLLVGDRKASKKDLLEIVAPAVPAEPYQAVEAAFRKEIKKTLRLSALVYEYLGEKASFLLSNALMRLIEKLLVTKHLVTKKGATVEVVAKRLGVHPYRCKLAYVDVAARHSLDDLVGHMKTLCRLDETVKGSARSKRTHVELALLSIARGIPVCTS